LLHPPLSSSLPLNGAAARRQSGRHLGGKAVEALSGASRPGRPEDLQREEALDQWRGIVDACGLASTLFVQMHDDAQQAEAGFRASFHGKPAATLRKRACSLLQVARWAAGAALQPFPVTEPTVFAYLRFLTTESAPPSRAQSFREALGFAKGFIGLWGVDDVLSSRRVSGEVVASLDRRAEKKQQDVLPVVMVHALEELICSPECNAHDKVFVGFVWFCLHARARVGDALRADRETSLDVDDDGEGYV